VVVGRVSLGLEVADGIVVWGGSISSVIRDDMVLSGGELMAWWLQPVCGGESGGLMVSGGFSIISKGGVGYVLA